MDASTTHGIAPISYQGGADKAMQVLASVISQQPRTEILTGDGSYIHATFTSLVFRFVDDVEFLLDAKAGVIHVRSASRVGESDLGVNRRRVEKLRDLFAISMKENSS